MSIKDKILNMITAHPKLLTLGIALGITFVVGTSIGMLENNQFAFATASSTTFKEN